MARRNESPQKEAMREMMSVLLEGVLDEELDEELTYSKGKSRRLLLTVRRHPV